MLNLNTKKINQTRDVVWLGKCYNHWCKNEAPSNGDDDRDEDIGDSMEDYVTLNPKESSIEKDQVTQEETRRSRANFIAS
jgi:hypothetical protein